MLDYKHMKESMEQPIVPPQAKKGIEDILHQYGGKLEKSAFESEGFLYVPAENIKIIPASEKDMHGTLEISEPQEKTGTEDFDLRDKFEKAWPVGDVAPAAEWENAVFNGEISPPPFHPEVGGRVCFTDVHTYETQEGVFVLMPIHPETDAKYGLGQNRKQQAKLSGTNMLRGARFPSAQEMVAAAQAKVTHNLQDLQAQNREEKIISQSTVVPTGLWNVRLLNQKGKYSEIKNCHVQRDPSTGTLDLFQIQKQYIFDEFDSFHPQENLSLGLERANALVSLDVLKGDCEDKPLEIKRLYFANKEIEDILDLPDSYQDIFEEKEGRLFLKNFKPTPPLKAFLELENRIIQEKPQDLSGEIRQKIGELFEDLMATALQREKNKEKLQVEIPDGQELQQLLADHPEEFRNWALNLKDKVLTTYPDFILEDGTFVEAKTGGKMDLKPEKRDQIFRMILYKLIRKETPKIRVISLEGPTSQDGTFDFLQYENFFDTELAKNVTEQDLEPIKRWQSLLAK